MPYELLSHTADVRILAKGNSLTELFTSALEGLCAVLIPGYEKKEFSDESLIITESIDISALLIDFLSDALTQMHSKKCLFYSVEFEELNQTLVKALLRGYNVKKFEDDVKAVTYHEAEVKTNEAGYLESVIVLDI